MTVETIDATSDIMSGLTPEEQAAVPEYAEAFRNIQMGDAQGKDARTQLYESIQNMQSGLKDRRAEIIQQMGSDAPMSKSQVAAMMLIGIIPTLVGGAIKGKKGLAKGAEAGSVGVQLMAKGMEGDRLRNEKRLESELSAVDKQLAATGALEGKAKLDEINAADTATQKELDRQTTLQAADIRAKGEAAKGGAGEKEIQKLASKAFYEADEYLDNTKQNAGRVKEAVFNAINKGAASYTDNAADAYLQSGIAALDPNTPIADVKRALSSWVLQEVEKLTTGAPSDRDTARIAKAQAEQGGVTVKTLLEVATRSERLAKERWARAAARAHRTGVEVPSRPDLDNTFIIQRKEAKSALLQLQKENNLDLADIEDMMKTGDIIIID